MVKAVLVTEAPLSVRSQVFARGGDGKLGLRDSVGWPDQLLTSEPVRADAVALKANTSCLHFQDGEMKVRDGVGL